MLELCGESAAIVLDDPDHVDALTSMMTSLWAGEPGRAARLVRRHTYISAASTPT
jgi:hypothetical protein